MDSQWKLVADEIVSELLTPKLRRRRSVQPVPKDPNPTTVLTQAEIEALGGPCVSDLRKAEIERRQVEEG